MAGVTPDPLGRGWRPPALNRRRKAGLALALGLLLVLTPFWAGPLAGALAPQETYRYEAVPVAPDDGSFAIEGPDRGLQTHGIFGVDCYADEDRTCLYAYALRNRSVTVPDHWFQDSYGFVHLDRFYDPRVTDTEAGSRLHLEPVTPGRVLATISQDPTGFPSATRQAVTTGAVTSSERLAGEGVVFETGNGYVLVTLVAINGEGSGVSLPPLALVEFLGVFVGLGLLRVGQRDYDRWQSSLDP